jgi:hypothetical protein
MRSFLKDAKRYLPTTSKPDGDCSSFFARLGLLCSGQYNKSIAKLRKQSIWNQWLWSLEREADLWAVWPFVFFTGDGQIGLAAEEAKVGDIVCELDGRKADSIILRKTAATCKRFLVVGTSRKVLGASGPTPEGALQRITVSVDAATLQALSERFGDTPFDGG